MIDVDKSRVLEPMIHLLFITTLTELIHELLTSKDSYAWVLTQHLASTKGNLDHPEGMRNHHR